MLKYQIVKKQLKKDLQEILPDESLPAIRILIKKYNTSLSTISRALDELEKGEWIIRKKGAGIFPRKKTVRKNTKSVGVILHCLDYKFYSLLLNGITSELIKSGISVKLYLINSRGEKILNALHGADSNSCLMITPSTRDTYDKNFIDEIMKFSKSGMEIIGVDIPVPGLSCDFIGFDNETAFFRGVSHLISKGSKKLFIAGNFGSSVYPNRQAGIRRACESNGAIVNKLFDTGTLKNVNEILAAYLESDCDGIVSADANWTELLISSMRNERFKSVKMTGVVEEGTPVKPCKRFIILEKPSYQMGVEAANIYLNNHNLGEEKQVKILQIKVHLC